MRITLMLTIFFTFILLGCHEVSSPYSNSNTGEKNNTDTMEAFEMNAIEEENQELLGQKVDAASVNFRSTHTVRQPSVSEDQEMMEGIIYDLPNIEPGTVIIVGNYAWVNIMFETPLTADEKEKQILELEKRLYEANPNYKYEIVVNDFMHKEPAL